MPSPEFDLSPARITSRHRRGKMREGLDIAQSSGVEVGPLADPVVNKAEGRVRYVDHTDTESLRRQYADNPAMDAAEIVEVDAVWGSESLSDCLDGERFDYVMASHVAEHVPDLITWLEEVRSVLRPGGELRLALPDARFSHDALREQTRLLDLLAAWIVRARRPQVRDVLDFRLHVAPEVDARTIYAGTADLSAIRPQHSVAEAIQAASWARDFPDHYFDVHCWVVAPLTLARLMQRLAELGMVQLACAEMIDTAPPIWEFYVFLRAGAGQDEVVKSWRDIQAKLRDPLPGSGAWEAARADAEARARAAQASREHQAAVAMATRLAGELAGAERRLLSMERSASWRLTAPLRRVRAWLG